jgi:hypothetical protein
MCAGKAGAYRKSEDLLFWDIIHSFVRKLCRFIVTEDIFIITKRSSLQKRATLDKWVYKVSPRI